MFIVPGITVYVQYNSANKLVDVDVQVCFVVVVVVLCFLLRLLFDDT